MAYTGNSIVDFLSSSGQNSSFNNRASLAKQYGIGNYTGSSDQNLQLLGKLRGANTPSPATSSAPSVPAPQIQSSYQAPNFEDTIRRAQQMQQEAYKPLISQLQGNVPEIQKNFASQRQTLENRRKPLQERYDNLIADLKNRETQDVNKQTVVTNNELGKRGILGSSTLAQQEIVNATQPISQSYGAQVKDVGLAGQEAQQKIDEQISGLSSAELESIRGIQNAIAQFQAQGNTEGISLGQNLIRNALDQQGFLEGVRQFDAGQDLALKRFNQIELPTTRAQLAKLGKETSGITAEDFLKGFGGGGNLVGFSTGKLSIGRNVADLINQGKFDQAIELAMNP